MRQLMSSRLSATVMLVGALSFGVMATGCSDDKASDKTASTTTAPEDARTSDVKVAAGLAKINATATGIAAASAINKAKAQQLVDDIEPAWQPIEGTIKENSQDTYLAFEDAFAVLGKAADDGDASAAAGAVKDIAGASASYLQDYPG